MEWREDFPIGSIETQHIEFLMASADGADPPLCASVPVLRHARERFRVEAMLVTCPPSGREAAIPPAEESHPIQALIGQQLLAAQGQDRKRRHPLHVPVVHDGRSFGTLCSFGAAPAETRVGGRELALLQQVAGIVARQLGRPAALDTQDAP